MRRKLCPHFEHLFWKKVSADTLPQTSTFLESEVWEHFFPHCNPQFSYIYQKNNEVSLKNVFHLFPPMNDSGKKSPRRLRHPAAQSSVKQLQRYYSLSCLWWKQWHSHASVGNKGVHSSRVIQFFVSWLSPQTQKSGDELMFTRVAET